MFDLWGTNVTTPLPSLEIGSSDAPLKEKLEWERELLGIYFSEHPLASVASKLSNATTALCGQINEERVGETVIIAGIVTSIRQLYTKDKRPFLITSMEDLDGSIEVTVWSDTYEQSKHLWQEGEILLVEGKVRLRDDRVTLNCQRVRLYEPDGESPQQPEAKKEPEPEPIDEPPQRHKLTITLKEDDNDDEENVDLLHRVMDTLSSYPGEDTVQLVIANSEKVLHLELSPISYCPELSKKLNSILGNGYLKLETINEQY
jgi:DNA polymerase-3 subunit alpha